MMENKEFVRYATIIDIIKEMKKREYKIGRTALVKLIYLLQENLNVPVGYDFSLYTYGPFAKEILDDLDYLSYLDAVKTEVADGRYDILPGENSVIDYIDKEAKPFIEENKEKISDIVEKFGSLPAKSLELITTIHFVVNDYKENNIDFMEKDIARLIHEIKPYFSEDEVLENIDKLKQNGLIDIITQ